MSRLPPALLATAEEQAGVLGRRQVARLGVGRSALAAHLRAGRLVVLGRGTLRVPAVGAAAEVAAWWAAVLGAGPRAALDGVSALQAAGLRGFDSSLLHVVVPQSSRPPRLVGVRVRESRLWDPAQLVGAGVPRIRPDLACVRAVRWAASDRQAVLVATMAVQQRLVRPAAVARQLQAVRRHPRRALLATLLRDLGSGSESLGELDLAREFRRKGLPEPERQAVRQLGSGRAYLDLFWPAWGLVCEVDGSHHAQAGTALADCLRDLEVTGGGETVIRVSLLAVRLDLDAVVEGFRGWFLGRGWVPQGGGRARPRQRRVA